MSITFANVLDAVSQRGRTGFARIATQVNTSAGLFSSLRQLTWF
jgi:hypothetical protein